MRETKLFNQRRGTQNQQKKPDEHEQKLLDVSRVARVTAGGRRFSFRAVLVIGDRAGNVAVSVKKGKDVQFAVEKAVRSAKKELFRVPMTKEGTIPYETYGKYGSAVVFLKPVSAGRGIIAGGAVRAVCDLAGYKSIMGKIISRSGNKLNNAMATLEALKKIRMSHQNVETQELVKTEKKTTKKSATKKATKKAKPKSKE